jgi:sugar transferase (PEP-CTERM/EpsH1 system associated)
MTQPLIEQSRPLRILLVTPSIPYPPNWGFGIRVYQFLHQLSRSHRVSLVCYAQPDEEDKVAALQKICYSVHTVPAPLSGTADKRAAQLASLFSPRSFQTGSLRTRSMQNLLTSLLNAEPFDLVQIESSQLGSYNFGTQPVFIVDEHNLEYELLQRMIHTERSPLRKLYNFSEYIKFRREEQRCWQRADACILTSEREQTILKNHLPGKLTHVAPNGVDIEFFQPSPSLPNPDSLVFTGLISYRPNTDAVIFFVKEVLPLIVQKRPRTVFYIVGMGAPDEVTRLAGPNVVVTGKVDDVRPYIQDASVFVVPLRMGSGTRLKVLEGLAMGKAMVSTRLGCEGIHVRDGEHLLMADDPALFARATLNLMEDRKTALRLGEAGRALVEQEYSWASIVQAMNDFHWQALDAKRQRAGLPEPISARP